MLTRPRRRAAAHRLTDTELNDIRLIGQTYDKVVVVLNTGGIVDTSFFSQINTSANDTNGGRPLDSLLLMSQAGQESGNALAKVLDGTVGPTCSPICCAASGASRDW